MSTVSLGHKAERLSIGIKNFGTDAMRIKANRHHFMVEFFYNCKQHKVHSNMM